MPALAEVAREKLQALQAAERRRSLVTTEVGEGVTVLRGEKRLISFSSNDYLGLAQRPEVKAAAIAATERYGCGAAASRLVSGNHPLYTELETKLAAWKGTEKALVFGSGYLANMGILTALMNREDVIIADKLVHACLIDGAKLSGATLLRFAHNTVADCERLLKAYRDKYRNCLIVTEEVFSMDGDIAPLTELAQLAAKYDAWLMSDGAHAITPSHLPVDIAMGTLSKAFGGYGGYVCAKAEVIDYLTTTARSVLFSTGLPPAVIASAIAALDIIQGDPWLCDAPLAKAKLFTKALGLSQAQSPIVPLVLGEESRALMASRVLEAAGYLVVAIRPPTVPEGSSRLRLAFSALHRDEDILHLAGFIKEKGWV
jgi:8-amino-7-oxononanoate synthase